MSEKNFDSQPTADPPGDGQHPHLAIPIGDPCGIGPEIVLKALADESVRQNCHLTAIGSRELLLQTYRDLRQIIPQEPLADPEKISILDVPLGDEISIGKGNAASGAASFAYLERAIFSTQEGKFQGIVTGPIAKSLWKAAGYNYPGQTEVLAQRTGTSKFGMLFVARSPHTGWTCRTLLATTHIPLARVPTTLNPQLMTLKLDLLVQCLKKDFGLQTPAIAISGLNPHSGEEGQLGTEERDWLIPWLEGERQKRPEIKLIGPIPPDTMWVQPGIAWYGNGTSDSSKPQDRPFLGEREKKANIADAYLALYHDQGLIPLKLMAFDRAINTTIGLPFIRTSPDHGTAFDIAGMGIANPSSMKEAIQLAARLTAQRRA